MEKFKELILHKLSLRVAYIVVAFLTSKLITFVACSSFLAYSQNSGFIFKITDPEKFKTSLMTLLLIGGEFVYRMVHDKFILPHVSPPLVQMSQAIINLEQKTQTLSLANDLLKKEKV